MTLSHVIILVAQEFMRMRCAIEQYNLHITQFAVACEFVGCTNFSKNYARKFDISLARRRA